MRTNRNNKTKLIQILPPSLKLVLKLEGSYNVTIDYMTNARRYMPDESSADQHRYYMKDHQGTVVAMTDHDQNKGYH